MAYVAQLFADAWELRRRRHRRVAWAGLAFSLGVIAVLHATSGDRQAPSQVARVHQQSGTTVLAPSAALAGHAMMGIHCLPTNSKACNLGLAIWLKRPAQSVHATVGGRTFPMDRVSDRSLSDRRSRTEYDGFFLPAAIVRPTHGGFSTYRLILSSESRPTVRLLIDYGQRHRVITQMQVPLMAGWG